MSKIILSLFIALISLASLGFARTIINNKGGAATVETHHCTEDDKNVKICYTSSIPVCGDDNVTYPNGCSACKAPNVKKYTSGPC